MAGDMPGPNWYPDPEGNGLRWWDGSAWTDHRREAPKAPEPSIVGIDVSALSEPSIGEPAPAPDLQEVARRAAADPAMWVRPRSESPTEEALKREKKDWQGFLGLVAIGLIGLLIYVGIHHSSGNASTSEPAPAASESMTYEQKYEAAHDAVCEHAPWKYEAEC